MWDWYFSTEVPAAYAAPNLSWFLVKLDRKISIWLLVCHCSLQAINSIIKYQQFWVFHDSFYPFHSTGLNRSFPLILSQALRQSDSFNRLFNNGLTLNEALFSSMRFQSSKTSFWHVICQYRLCYSPSQARDSETDQHCCWKYFRDFAPQSSEERFNGPEAKTVPVSSVCLDCGSQLEGYNPRMANFFLLLPPCLSILLLLRFVCPRVSSPARSQTWWADGCYINSIVQYRSSVSSL